jgi:flavin reductase (DIM6/NTAB) family NADH-FMN oxidoreductase RutF
MRVEVDCYEALNMAINNMPRPGILLNAIGDGKPNTMTIGWGLLGWSYHGHPVAIVAVTPLRYTFQLLEQVDEFVLSVLPDELSDAVAYCGRVSGKDRDKFKDTNLTIAESLHVRPPSIKEALVNLECRTYHKEHPPHMILTPKHRTRPLSEQHTIYFAEVLGTYRYE